MPLYRIVLLFCLCAISLNDAHISAGAQTATTSGATANAGRKIKAPPRDPRQYDVLRIGSLNALPTLPQYKGNMRYIMGKCYPHHHRGKLYNFMMETKETPAQVIEWYKNALPGNGWKVEQDAEQRLELYAVHSAGDTLELSVYATSQKDWPSAIQMMYCSR